MNIEQIKKNREWKQTKTGVIIALPTIEEVSWLISEHDRLTNSTLTLRVEELQRAVDELAGERDRLAGEVERLNKLCVCHGGHIEACRQAHSDAPCDCAGGPCSPKEHEAWVRYWGEHHRANRAESALTATQQSAKEQFGAGMERAVQFNDMMTIGKHPDSEAVKALDAASAAIREAAKEGSK